VQRLAVDEDLIDEVEGKALSGHPCGRSTMIRCDIATRRVAEDTGRN